MNILKKYILNNLFMIFLSILIPLFAIASIVFMIKLATYTAIIQLSILDMIKLYLFIIPELLFYTLPVSFFIAATMSLFRLSTDNELVVIFSLGISPKYILKTLGMPAVILSFLLFVNYLVVIPHVKTLTHNFIFYKKSEAKFNLSASEFGHSFGKWLLYIKKENNDDTYSDVILFNKEDKEEIFIDASKAKIINNSGILKLELLDGKAYTYSKEKLSQINFETMYINYTIKTNLTSHKNPIEFWLSNDDERRKNRMLITNTLLSLFPVLSLFLVLSIGIVHERDQKAKIYFYLFFGILFFYGLTIGIQKHLLFYTIPITIITWLTTTYIIYRRRIIMKF